MPWRKWFVRCLVLTVATACGAAALVYSRWTDAAVVRGKVLDQLRRHFPGAEVAVESAHLRILGGIQVRGIRLSRPDDADLLALIPSAVVFHDKEKLLEGELNLRKVELMRPRLRAVRKADGKWNLEGIAGLLSPERSWPTLVVQQGVLVLEDQAKDGTGLTLELTEVHLVCLNDPLTVVNISGSAHSSIFGDIAIEGRWHRDSRACRFSMKAAGLPLDAGWARKIPCPRVTEYLAGTEFTGEASLELEAAYDPASSQPLSYEGKLELRKGCLRSSKLPLDLEDLTAAVHLVGQELRVEKFRARSGTAVLSGSASTRLGCMDRDYRVQMQIAGLRLTETLARRLPEPLPKLERMFAPSGTADVHFDLLHGEEGWKTLPDGSPSRVRLLAHEVDLSFERFPYPVKNVTGSVCYDFGRKRTEVDIRGLAGVRPVAVKGHWEGKGEDAEARFEIAGTDLVLEDALYRALPDGLEKRARSFRARGKVDVRAVLRKEADWDAFRNEYHLKFHETTLDWEDFPLALVEVAGYLDIYPDRWECRDFQGRHQDGLVQAACRSRPERPGKGITIELSGRNLPLDDALRRALSSKPALLKTWDTLRPRGRFDFAAVIERPENPAGTEIRLDLKGGTYVPAFFPCAVDLQAVQVRYSGQHVELLGFRGSRGETDLRLDRGDIILKDGGYFADLKDLHLRRLRLDDETVAGLPGPLRKLAESLQLEGPLTVKTRLVIAQEAATGSQPDCYWDAQAWLADSSFRTGIPFRRVNGTLACLGRHDGRVFQGLQGNLVFDRAEVLGLPCEGFHAHFRIDGKTPDVLTMNLKAPLFGGDVAGQVRLDFHSSLGYELNLTASQIDLARLGKHSLGPNNQLAGILVGRLHLTGKGTSLGDLEGNGSLDIPFGRILNLPLLLDLLKVLGLRWPDRTAFEELHAAFGIQGRRVHMRHLELLGNAVSLTGQGEFDLDGTNLKLDFYPRWARMEQMLPPAVRPLPPALTKNLLTIQVRGQVGSGPDDLKFHKRPVPLLLDPLLEWRERMRGSTAPGEAVMAPRAHPATGPSQSGRAMEEKR